MTTPNTQPPTEPRIQCDLIPGVGFFAVVDGVEWRSMDGGCWIYHKRIVPNPDLASQLTAAAYEAMGEVMKPKGSHDVAEFYEDTEEYAINLIANIPDPDGLTETERAAVAGAIRDTERGLAVGLSAEPERHSAIFDYSPKVHPFTGTSLPTAHFWKMKPSQSVVWDTRTGQRTVLDVAAFREAVGVESEEWLDWCEDAVVRKDREPGVDAVMTSKGADEITRMFKDPSFDGITHILDRTTGHWHTRPEPEEEPYTGVIDWELGLYENRHGEQIALCPNDVRMFRSDDDSEWESLALMTTRQSYRRVSPNPPRVRVEEEG